MSDSLTKTRDALLEEMLPDVVFDGWRWDVALAAAPRCGFAPGRVRAVFPGGLPDIVAHFSDWADRRMMAALKDTDSETLRVRNRIRTALLVRLDVLRPHREAVRQALAYWAMPLRGARAAKTLWRTADVIWRWAGDTATDYNRYTKRALLSGVISSTVLAWLGDDSGDLAATGAFLDRRIENVMQIGRIVGKLKKAS